MDFREIGATDRLALGELPKPSGETNSVAYRKHVAASGRDAVGHDSRWNTRTLEIDQDRRLAPSRRPRLRAGLLLVAECLD